MGRVKAAVVSVTCLALLVLSMPLAAQEPAQEKKAAPAMTKKLGIWKKVADGIWEAHVPRFPDEKEGFRPEFAVLRLTPKRYEEFKKDRKDFLNDRHIFRKDVNKADIFSEAKPKQEDPDNSYWYVTVAHWPSSTAAIQSYPGWSEPQ